MSSESDRFWSKVNKTDFCWLWTGGCYGKYRKYGSFYVGKGKRSIPAHRWSYQHLVGEIPEGYVIDHLCRNTLCVNPEHLEAITNRENILRGVSSTAMQARQTECKRGHDLSDAHILSGGRRDCRQCRKLRNARRSKKYRKQHG
jgi:hypothetical protein